MRKFFLIPLMTLVCSVMAWGSEITVNNFADLKTALSSEGTADVVKLGANITYGSELLNIQRSLTLDGNGFTITGNIVSNLSVSSNKTFNKNAILAVNKGGSTSANLDVKIQNLKLTHSGKSQREIPFVIFDGVKKFTLDGVETYGPNNDFQALLITGTDDTALQLVINNSVIRTANYPMYILKPITATLTNSTIAGYCGMYFKKQWSDGNTGYGDTPGTRGSVVNADACTFDCRNSFSGASNNFAIFPLEDDGITLNLHNCSLNAETLGNTYQRFLNLQYLSRTEGFQPVIVKITGDNTHLYNVTADKVVFNGFTVGQIEPAISEGTCARVDVAINFTVEAGTFTFDPRDVHWYTYSDNKTAVKPSVDYSDQSEGSGAITIDLTKYQINEVKQGDKTLYRVVKKAAGEKEPGVKYDLNDDVPTDVAGEGNNPSTSFELSTGSEMILNQETTKAGYVEVKDNGSSEGTTVKVGKVVSETKVDQTLIINNGLDVQGNSKVEVQAGSALIIGEGGITTEAPENIVIEADKDGAATLLMDPTITVNQTPELTVKMTAQGVGKIGANYFWHRFALPVDHVQAGDGSWAKEGHTYDTYLYKWDYTNNEWASLQELSEMQPFYGYTLSIEESCADPAALKNPVYVFKGNLTGNVNSALNFSRQGYNFFGNSYTGYISILQLVNELIGNDDLDATVWMWNTKGQRYEGIPLNDLKNDPTAPRYNGQNSWKKEVAPMQTFILRLMTGNTGTTAEINYASAVWGNPRYEAITGVTPAPARRVQRTEDAYVRIVVSAANGKADAINFQEDANLSDANDRGYDAAKYMNERTINVYSTIDGENFGTIATDNLEGKKLTINTIDEIAYTISFEDVEGNAYALRDNVTGQVIAIEEGATYDFAAQPNSVVENRFEIVNVNKMPTAIENTEVKANVKGIYTIMGQYLGEDFDILPAGVYVVNGVKIVK